MVSNNLGFMPVTLYTINYSDKKSIISNSTAKHKNTTLRKNRQQFDFILENTKTATNQTPGGGTVPGTDQAGNI